MPSTAHTAAAAILMAATWWHAPGFAQDTPDLGTDRWGIYATQLTWNSSARLDRWIHDEDWTSYAGYYTDDLLSGYGGALGRYDWGDDEWRFGGWSDEGPRARRIDWRSDRFGVYEDGLRWSTDSIGFDRWSDRAAFDWAGSQAPGSGGWFPF